jgi:hypothetical protein
LHQKLQSALEFVDMGSEKLNSVVAERKHQTPKRVLFALLEGSIYFSEDGKALLHRFFCHLHCVPWHQHRRVILEDIAQLLNHKTGKLNLLRDVFDPTVSWGNSIDILVGGLRQLQPAPAA